MITALKSLNLALRFGLELALLAALTVYCWRTLPSGTARLVGSVGIPLVVMVIWATFVHGPAIPAPVQIAVQVALFGVAVAAVAVLGRPELALTFAGTAVVNAALMVAWSQ